MEIKHQNAQNTNILLSSAYFPPIDYIKSIINSELIIIEQHENYIKQSYRNRCKIMAANGVLSLSIPVELATNKKIRIKDVKIDYKTNWQKQHYKSIESAYRTSPFFEYLIDDFNLLFTKKYLFLLDLNTDILKIILDILESKKDISYSSGFEKDYNIGFDLRDFYHPKKTLNSNDTLKSYPQVFDTKFGFQSDLSILDLIFNLGPEAYTYLIGKY